MRSFQDASLATGVFLLHLLDTVRGIVNWSLVTRAGTVEEKKQNAQYVIRWAVLCAVCCFLCSLV
jgi:hypothetical protein